MPSIRKKVAGFIRQLSNPGSNDGESPDLVIPKSPGPESGCFIQRYLSGDIQRSQPEILHGRTGQDLPCLRLMRFRPEIMAACTGPDGGLLTVNVRQRHVSIDDPDVGFIDSDEESLATTTRNRRSRILDPDLPGARRLLNSATMTIRAMGNTYYVPVPREIPKATKVTPLSPRPTSLMIETPLTALATPPHSIVTRAHSNPVTDDDLAALATLPTITEVESPPAHAFSPDSAPSGDDQQYHEFLAQIEAHSLSINVTDPRRSVTKMDSPDSDDTVCSSINGSEEATPSTEARTPVGIAIIPEDNEKICDNGNMERKTEESCDVTNANLVECTESRTRLEQNEEKCAKQEKEEKNLSLAAPQAPLADTVSKEGKGVNTATESQSPVVVVLRRAGKKAKEPEKEIELEPEAEEEDGDEEENSAIAGVIDWACPHTRAYGSATSLYEMNPVSGERAGNPVADAWAIVARQNAALLVLADGVNWGVKAATAARSAVHGCVEYLNKAVFATPNKRLTTADIFISLLRSFHAAHSMILQEDGLLTTLTAAIVVPVDASAPVNPNNRPNTGKFAVCVCNVGDSLAYVYSPVHGVREVTQGSHDIHSMRDMRDALGALGPVDGQNPELHNLTCSLTLIDPGDIVFLTSDGVSDNFDPVVGKFVVPKKSETQKSTRPQGAGTAAAAALSATSSKRAGTHSREAKDHSASPVFALPTVEAYQRHELSLLRMEDLLRHGVNGCDGPCSSAQGLCEDMIDFATRLTAAKRRLLEDPDLYSGDDGNLLDKAEQRNRRRRMCDRLALIPGKLDHASVVAYQAGTWPTPHVNVNGGTRPAGVNSGTFRVGSGAGLRAPAAKEENSSSSTSSSSSASTTTAPTATAPYLIESVV